MLFPIGDDQVKGGHYPIVTYLLLALNIGAFLYEIQMSPQELEAFIFTYGSIPAETVRFQNLYTLFTSMFLHGGWMHLIGNMLFLWVFADNIEVTVGNLRFLIFYLLGGLAAHALHIYFNINSGMPTVGASGAISAVLGAYIVMFPGSRVKLWFIFLVFRVPAVLFLGFWIWQQWVAGTASLGMAIEENAGVAWWAHIGGFVFGVAAGFYYRSQGYLRKNQPYNPYS